MRLQRAGENYHVRQGDVADLDIVVPLVEQLDVANLLCDVLGKDIVDSAVLDLDISGVRHFCGLTVVRSGTDGGTAVSSTEYRDGIFREVEGALCG